MSLAQLLIVGSGGFIGTILRYLTGFLCVNFMGSHFPYGTLSVNVVGSFFIGLIFGLTDNFLNISNELKLFLTIGILGGFTTFSSFSYETVNLIGNRQFMSGITNIFLNLFLGLIATQIGLAIARIIH